jgi:Flp pilus assembly protein TadB
MSMVAHDALSVVAVLAAAVAALAAFPRRSPVPLAVERPPASTAAPHAVDPAVAPLVRVLATLVVAAGAWLLVGGLVGGVLAPVTGGFCWWYVGRLEPPGVRRRRERLASAVPQVVDLMAACLGAGLSPSTALEHVAAAIGPPAADELAAVSARLRLGVDPATVWRDLARHPQLGGLGRALARAVESGASVADAMQRLSADLRRAARSEVESRARAVGVKAAVPLGVCLLPAFVLVGVVPLVAGAVGVLAGP